MIKKITFTSKHYICTVSRLVLIFWKHATPRPVCKGPQLLTHKPDFWLQEFYWDSIVSFFVVYTHFCWINLDLNHKIGVLTVRAAVQTRIIMFMLYKIRNGRLKSSKFLIFYNVFHYKSSTTFVNNTHRYSKRIYSIISRVYL